MHMTFLLLEEAMTVWQNKWIELLQTEVCQAPRGSETPSIVRTQVVINVGCRHSVGIDVGGSFVRHGEYWCNML